MKRIVFIVIALCILATGCSALRQREAEPPVGASSPEAEALFSRLQSRNSHLNSFKGTGRLRIKNADGFHKTRLMWAGHRNEKLRLVIMGLTGQPVFSFANDGERIYLISHTENRFFSRRESDANLEKLISLPITVSACLDLLAGRIPLAPHLLPVAVLGRKGDEQVLILKSQDRKKGHEHIFLDTASGNVRRVEAFDKDDNLVYRAEFVRMQHVSGFMVPRELRLSNGGQTSLLLVVERFWANVPVAEDLFKLAKPV